LLRDLIFLFQGIDGQYVRFDTSLNDPIIVSGTRISRSTQDMVLKLAEIGWLYLKVRNFIRDTKHTPSLVGQSLCAALQHELTAYYKLIALLEAQQDLTLKRLVVWTLESHKKLRLMSVLTDVCHEKGGALLSVIHNYTNHGDPFIKSYLIELLQIVSKPFYEMLERWVYEGELDDPYDEFFVACDPTQEDLWQSKYTLRQDMLPKFMSKDLAHKIFSIGKSLNFIRYSCHDDTLSQQYHSSEGKHLQNK
jgi:gamma-tubulin complex component 3